MASDDAVVDSSHSKMDLADRLAGATERLYEFYAVYEREVPRLMDEAAWLRKEAFAFLSGAFHERETWARVLASPSGSLSTDALAFLGSTIQAYAYECDRRIEAILGNSYLVLEHKSDFYDAAAFMLETLDHEALQTADKGGQSHLHASLKLWERMKQNDSLTRDLGDLRRVGDMLEPMSPTPKQKCDCADSRWQATSDRFDKALSLAYARFLPEGSEDPIAMNETFDPSLDMLTLEDEGDREAAKAEEEGSNEQA